MNHTTSKLTTILDTFFNGKLKKNVSGFLATKLTIIGIRYKFHLTEIRFSPEATSYASRRTEQCENNFSLRGWIYAQRLRGEV